MKEKGTLVTVAVDANNGCRILFTLQFESNEDLHGQSLLQPALSSTCIVLLQVSLQNRPPMHASILIYASQALTLAVLPAADVSANFSANFNT